jgi:threonine dehydrogenase-like Zn-dependent dehydrogenase
LRRVPWAWARANLSRASAVGKDAEDGFALSSRLALARELGATHTLESRGAETPAEIRKITSGGADFALETSAGRVSACRRQAAKPRHLHLSRQRSLRHGGQLRDAVAARAAGLCAA